jgi:hypothetical protein
MIKIHNSIKDPLTSIINIRVKPEYADSFRAFLDSKGFEYDTDGQIHPLNIVGIGEVQCCPFILPFSEELRYQTGIWDSEVDHL